MIKRLTVFLAILVLSSEVFAEERNYPIAKVSFDDFKDLVVSVEPHRATRLVDLNTFLKMSEEPGTIILDSRSDFRFERIHIKGAKHLSFSDYTQANLARVIPSFNTKILIYCNNNFVGNEVDFATKSMSLETMPLMPLESVPLGASRLGSQMASQARPVMLALNIPTYINLYGYGYRNIFELNELVNVKDPRIKFEGSVVPIVAGVS